MVFHFRYCFLIFWCFSIILTVKMTKFSQDDVVRVTSGLGHLVRGHVLKLNPICM
jgi:hypothetical protein